MTTAPLPLDERPVTFAERVRELARRHPDRPAIVFIPATGDQRILSYGGLDGRANQVARTLRAAGVRPRSRVLAALPNSPEQVLTWLGAWKLGACVVPVNPALPPAEQARLVSVAEPAVVVADWADRPDLATVSGAAITRSAGLSPAPVREATPHPGLGYQSSGSAGQARVILVDRPWRLSEKEVLASLFYAACGFRPGQRQLVAGPLYAGLYVQVTVFGLFGGQTIILMDRFDAARAVAEVGAQGAHLLALVPTMMMRILRTAGLADRDWSRLETVFHSAAACPDWVKRAWIELVGPERLYEGYGANEGLGNAVIRGDEWLLHPGSVGRPVQTEVRVKGEDGAWLGPGEVGELFFRRPWSPTYRYLGAAQIPVNGEGFASVGDLGWLDADGYMYIADRRVDMIISGGINIYAAEVEGALLSHPGVADAVVVGLSDPNWGRRVHAIVQAADPSQPPSETELDQHVRERLASNKAPKSYEFVSGLPRAESGKVRRSALLAERKLD